MNLSALGEDRLVERLTASLPKNAGLLVGPGDDCAVVGDPNSPTWTLLKTDCVVEGVHFTSDTDFRRVGWKALARAVSDIAAMGGLPQHALITLALPVDLPVEKVDALYSGLSACARKFGIAIAGGETSRSPAAAGGSPGPVFISVALTGEVEPSKCVLRSGGRSGDVLFVTGLLGGSIHGKHLDFTPRLQEARWLVNHFKIRAMMDISDGLAADLPRLAKASQCGFQIGAVPASPGATQEQAMRDGEDFELLFAVAPEDAAALVSTWPFPELPLTQIGRLISQESANSLIGHGYDHFTNPPRDV